MYHFFSAKVCKTIAITLLSRFLKLQTAKYLHKWGNPPRSEKCTNIICGRAQFVGGGCITNFSTQLFLITTAVSSKIHVGLVWLFVCFLVFASYIKVMLYPDNLIVFKTGCERYDSIWQVLRHVPGSDSLIVWYFTVKIAWKITPISVDNICHEISVALYWRVQIWGH